MFSTPRITNMIIGELIFNDIPCPTLRELHSLLYNTEVYYRRISDNHAPLLSERFTATVSGPELESINDFYVDGTVAGGMTASDGGDILDVLEDQDPFVTVAVSDAVSDVHHDGMESVVAMATGNQSAWRIAVDRDGDIIKDRELDAEATYEIPPQLRVVN